MKLKFLLLIGLFPLTLFAQQQIPRYKYKLPQKIYRVRIPDNRPKTAPVVTDPGNQVTSGENFTMRWNSVSGATFYDLQLHPDRSFTNAHTQGTNALNTTFHQEVTQQTTFYFRARARNNDGAGPWSNIVDMVVVPRPAETAPTEAPQLTAARAQVLSDQTYTISWTQPARASWFWLIESPSPTFDSGQGSGLTIPAGGTPSYSFHHAVSQPTIYYYRIRAANQAGNTHWSNTVQVTINPR
ncbi:MAG: hypothetical protein HYY62_01435 [Deltaproteobacteria bacterium]|nr:hypothetical protein [Deltaproteobacteria bacterium]